MLTLGSPCERGFLIKPDNSDYFLGGRLMNSGPTIGVSRYDANTAFATAALTVNSPLSWTLDNTPNRKLQGASVYKDVFLVYGERLTISAHTNGSLIKRTVTYEDTNFKYVICIDASTCIAACTSEEFYYYIMRSTGFLGFSEVITRLKIADENPGLTGMAAWGSINRIVICHIEKCRICDIGTVDCIVIEEYNLSADAAFNGTHLTVAMALGDSSKPINFYVSEWNGSDMSNPRSVFTMTRPISNTPYAMTMSPDGGFFFMTYDNHNGLFVYEKKPCHTSCATCSASNPTQCSTCLNVPGTNTPMIKDAVTGVCTACTGPGQFRYSNSSCGTCGPNCDDCSSSNPAYCTSCLNPSTYKVFPNKTCGTCTDPGFVTNGIYCEACISPCATCITAKTTCTSCVNTHCMVGSTCKIKSSLTTDWYLTTTTANHTCGMCPPSCLTCTETACLSCRPGFFKNGIVCTACPSTCTDCISSNSCTSCITSNYLLPTGSCGPCVPANKVFVSGGSCLGCEASCATCGSATACLSCPANQYIRDATGLCDVCGAGFYIGGDSKCYPCHWKCKTCNGAGDSACTSCRQDTTPPRYLKGTQCSVCNLQNEVVLSGVTCADCAASCTTCSGATTNCTSCTLPYFLFGNTCSLCGGSNFIDLTAGGACMPCSSNCATCQITSTKCLTCPSGQYLFTNNNTCTNCSLDGFYLQVADNKCHRCDSNCSTCLDPGTKCTSCVTGEYLFNSASSNCDPCTQNGTGVVGGKCDWCNANCRLCNNSLTNCLACYGNLTIMTADNNKCGNNCNATGGSYIETVSGVSYCKQCDSSCAECDQASTTCTKCVYPKILFEQRCIDCQTGCMNCSSLTHCTACEPSYFMTRNATCRASCKSTGLYVSGRECLECSANCKSCFGSAASCTSCIAGQYLSATNTCVPCTENGYYHNSTNCLQCDSSCLTCNGSTSTDCLTCVTAKVLAEDGSCQLASYLRLVSASFKSDIQLATFSFDRALKAREQVPLVSIVGCNTNDLRPMMKPVAMIPAGNSICSPFGGWSVREITTEGSEVKVKFSISETIEEGTILVVAPEIHFWQSQSNNLVRYSEDYLIVENVTVIKSALDGMMDSAAAPAAAAMTMVQTLVMTVSAPQAFVLMKMMQTLDYYIYIDCNYPSNFAKFLDMITNSAIEMLPNFFEMLVDNDGLPLYERFAEYGMKVHIFANLGQIYSAALIMVGIKFLLFLVGLVFKKGQKFHGIVAAEFFFGLFESYNLDSVLSIVIFIANREQINHRQDAVKYLVIVFVSLFSLFMISMYLFMGYTVSRLTDSYFKHAVVEVKHMKNEKMKFLLEDKNMHGNIFQRHFNLIQLFKDIVFAALLYALYYKPLVLIILLTLIQAGFGATCFVYPPFKIDWMNNSLKITQVLYFTLDCFFCVLLGISLDEKTRYYFLGFAMIANVLLILACNIGFTLYSTVRELRQKWRKWKKSKADNQLSKGASFDSSIGNIVLNVVAPIRTTRLSMASLAQVNRPSSSVVLKSSVPIGDSQAGKDVSALTSTQMNETSLVRGKCGSKIVNENMVRISKRNPQRNNSISIASKKRVTRKSIMPTTDQAEMQGDNSASFGSMQNLPDESQDRETRLRFEYFNKKLSKRVVSSSQIGDSSQN